MCNLKNRFLKILEHKVVDAVFTLDSAQSITACSYTIKLTCTKYLLRASKVNVMNTANDGNEEASAHRSTQFQ